MFVRRRLGEKESPDRPKRRRSSSAVPSSGGADAVLPAVEGRRRKQSVATSLVANLDEFVVPDDATAKAEVTQQLSDINEQARIAVLQTRRVEAAVSLDRVLGMVLKTYDAEVDAPASLRRGDRRTSKQGTVVAFPDIQETLRLVQKEQKGFTSQGDYERHLATKLWWLLKELSSTAQAKELFEEKFTRLHEVFSEREQRRVATLRKLHEMQQAYRNRVHEARRQEQEYEGKLADQESVIRSLRERVAELQQKDMLKREKERRSAAYASRIAESEGVPLIEQVPSACVDEAEFAALVAAGERDRAELARLNSLMDEVKKREQERQTRDKAVAEALADLEGQQRKRAQQDKHWEQQLRFQEAAGQDRETLRSRVKEAVAVVSQKDQEVQLLRNQFSELQAAFQRLATIREREHAEQQALAAELRDQSLTAAQGLEEQIALSEFARLEAERALQEEVSEHERTHGRMQKLQRLLVVTPSASALLQQVREQNTLMLPQVKQWLGAVISMVDGPKEGSESPASARQPLSNRTHRTGVGSPWASPSRVPPRRATDTPRETPRTPLGADAAAADAEPMPDALQTLRDKEKDAAQRRDYQEASRWKHQLTEALKVLDEAREIAHRKAEAAQHRERRQAGSAKKGAGGPVATVSADLTDGVAAKFRRASAVTPLPLLDLPSAVARPALSSQRSASRASVVEAADTATASPSPKASERQGRTPSAVTPTRRGSLTSRASLTGPGLARGRRSSKASPVVSARSRFCEVAVQADYSEYVRDRQWNRDLDLDILRMRFEDQRDEIRGLRALVAKSDEQLKLCPLFSDVVSYQDAYEHKYTESLQLSRLLAELQDRRDTAEDRVGLARDDAEKEKQRAEGIVTEIQKLQNEVRANARALRAQRFGVGAANNIRKLGEFSFESLRRDMAEEKELITSLGEQHRRRVAELGEELKIEQELRENEKARFRVQEQEISQMRQAHALLRTSLTNLARTDVDSEAELMCMSCLSLLREPVMCVPCGHVVCRDCADAANGITHSPPAAVGELGEAPPPEPRPAEVSAAEGSMLECPECRGSTCTRYLQAPCVARWAGLAEMRRRGMQQLQRALGIPRVLRDLGNYAPDDDHREVAQLLASSRSQSPAAAAETEVEKYTGTAADELLQLIQSER